MTWQPIESAPQDGTPIQARIPDHGEDNIIAWQNGFMDSDNKDCGCWVFVEDQEPPICWTDGVCWAVNEDGEPSVQPTHWRAVAIALSAAAVYLASSVAGEEGGGPVFTALEYGVRTQ